MADTRIFYWKFSIAPRWEEIRKAILCYRLLFLRPPTTVLTSLDDTMIQSMLLRMGIHAVLDPAVPSGQLWFHVPFGMVKED